MPEYKFISRFYLLWALFFSLIVSVCLILNGTLPWQTTILELALSNTKKWQRNIGIFICLLCVLGFFAFEGGSKGMSWLYVFCTISLALVAFVHAWIDLDAQLDALHMSQIILKKYFRQYENEHYTKAVDNFQRRLRCCGLNDKIEMVRGKQCHFVKSCCHWKAKNCTEEYVYQESCYSKADHVLHLLKLCAALGIIAGSVQLLVIFVLLWGGLKYLFNLMFPPGGPIIK